MSSKKVSELLAGPPLLLGSQPPQGTPRENGSHSSTQRACTERLAKYRSAADLLLLTSRRPRNDKVAYWSKFRGPSLKSEFGTEIYIGCGCKELGALPKKHGTTEAQLRTRPATSSSSHPNHLHFRSGRQGHPARAWCDGKNKFHCLLDLRRSGA